MKRTMRLNPLHPDWYSWNFGWALYLLGRYEEALAEMKRMKEPPFKSYRTLAAIYAQLDRMEEARNAVSEVLKHEPEYSLRKERAWPFKNSEDLEHLLDGYRKAGLPE